MSQPFRCLKKYDDFTKIDGEFEVFLQPQRFMITGGDANLRDSPQFSFAFQLCCSRFPSG
jgi:hypothetical protein